MLPDDAVSLAQLVQSAGGAPITDTSVDSLVATWKETQDVSLYRPVAVRFVYEIAELRDDSLILNPDIYGRSTVSAGAAGLRVLARNGIDTSRVDRTALQMLVRRARAKRAGIPVSLLLLNNEPASPVPPNQAWKWRPWK
jgi:hypothetical protein